MLSRRSPSLMRIGLLFSYAATAFDGRPPSLPFLRLLRAFFAVLLLPAFWAINCLAAFKRASLADAGSVSMMFLAPKEKPISVAS